jgi:putative acetyltransferase
LAIFFASSGYFGLLTISDPRKPTYNFQDHGKLCSIRQALSVTDMKQKQSSMTIRKREPPDNPALLALWRRSVTATHEFLTEDDIRDIEPDVRTTLPALEVWICASGDGIPVGFMGLNGSRVEMLFVEPACRGQGIGVRLLDHARLLRGALTLDVNEQNPQAHGFYLRYGFRETGRSATDAAGRLFPLIHMALHA